MRHRTWLLWAVLLVTSACSGEGAGAATSDAATSIAPPATISTLPPATTSLSPTTTSASPTTISSAPTTNARQIDVHFEGGQVVGQDRFSYALGELVSVWVLSDTGDEVHVHGYDLFFTVDAEVPLEISLTAEIPGIFEVELESTHTLLFELVVAP